MLVQCHQAVPRYIILLYAMKWRKSSRQPRRPHTRIQFLAKKKSLMGHDASLCRRLNLGSQELRPGHALAGLLSPDLLVVCLPVALYACMVCFVSSAVPLRCEIARFGFFSTGIPRGSVAAMRTLHQHAAVIAPRCHTFKRPASPLWLLLSFSPLLCSAPSSPLSSPVVG